VFLDFCVAALCNLGFTIYGSNIEQVWSPLVYMFNQTQRDKIKKAHIQVWKDI